MTSYNPESRFRLYMNFARLMALARKDWTFRPSDLAGIVKDGKESDFTGADIRNFWEEYVLDMKKTRQEHVIKLAATIPYCLAQCDFCLFYMERLRSNSQLEAYANLLVRTILYFSEVFGGVSFSRVYFDGGTPTMFSESQLERICRALFGNFHYSDDAFSDVEVHPYGLEPGKLQVLGNWGVNNACIGAQSMDPDVLRINNRGFQNRRMVRDAVRWAREAGMGVSTDLILGLAGDDGERFLRSFKELTELQPDFVQVYFCIPSAHYLAKHFNNSQEAFRAHLASVTPWLEKAVALAGSCGFEVLPGSFDSASGSNHRIVWFGRLGGNRTMWYRERDGNATHSIMRLGMRREYSNIYRKLTYAPVSISEDPAQSRYRGWKYSPGDEQRSYLFSKFETGEKISEEKFAKRFGVSIENIFGDAIASLRALGLMDDREGSRAVRLRRKGGAAGFRLLPQAGSMELFAASMFFLDFDNLARMVKRMAAGASLARSFYQERC